MGFTIRVTLGAGVWHRMRMKLSGLPLCKAGDWGLQTPEKCFCFGFFAAKPQKNQNKKGVGAAPQWETSVSLMRMGEGFGGAKPLPGAGEPPNATKRFMSTL